MGVVVESRRLSPDTIARRHPHSTILDVTSRGAEPWIRFSPFYPHGGVPVPFSSDLVSESVEGIWQGLKVFERADVDTRKFAIRTMRGLKRSQRANGRVLGHRAGVHGTELLDYLTARRRIYLPSYRWALDNRLSQLVSELKAMLTNTCVVLLDYETNDNPCDPRRPLSHAALIKAYVEDRWPTAAATTEIGD